MIMTTAIDSLKNMVAYRETELNRTLEQLDRFYNELTGELLRRAKLMEEIDDLKAAIKELEKNNAR